MDGKRMFRQAALERLASPERLDVTMEVTSSTHWLALAAVGLLLVAVIGWSVFGTISIKVRGQGILLSGQGVATVTSSAPGRVAEIPVRSGDPVEAGTVVARLTIPDVRDAYTNAREKLTREEQESVQQNARDQGLVDQLEAQAAELRTRLQDRKELLAQGNATPLQVLEIQQRLTGTEDQIAAKKSEIAGRTGGLEEQRRAASQLADQLASNGELRSPVAGRVIEVKVNVSDLLAPGSPVVSIEPAGKLKAVVFVPVSEGKKIAPGMKCQVSPATVKKEEWGLMEGKVEEVSAFPATRERLLRVLGDGQLVQELIGQRSAFEVGVELLRDSDSPSGFKWTSRKGPSQPIASGTVCAAMVTTGRRRPISYVLPVFRDGGSH